MMSNTPSSVICELEDRIAQARRLGTENERLRAALQHIARTTTYDVPDTVDELKAIAKAALADQQLKGEK